MLGMMMRIVMMLWIQIWLHRDELGTKFIKRLMFFNYPASMSTVSGPGFLLRRNISS
jgi:hypothetical protein